jgi:hypothetical protein
LSKERRLRAIADHEYAEKIQQDFLGGVRSGVNGTPTFFINDQRHDGGFDFNTLVSAIEARLEKATPCAAPSVRRCITEQINVEGDWIIDGHGRLQRLAVFDDLEHRRSPRSPAACGTLWCVIYITGGVQSSAKGQIETHLELLTMDG